MAVTDNPQTHLGVQLHKEEPNQMSAYNTSKIRMLKQ